MTGVRGGRGRRAGRADDGRSVGVGDGLSVAVGAGDGDKLAVGATVGAGDVDGLGVCDGTSVGAGDGRRWAPVTG